MLRATPDPESRRSRFFARLCEFIALMAPLFYGVGWLQGGRRAVLVALTTTLVVAAALVCGQLARRGRLSAAVHLFVALLSGTLLFGSLASGRGGPILMMTLLMATVATIQLQRLHMLLDFAMVGTATTVVMLAVPPMDGPAYYATAALMLLFTATVGYTNAMINQADLQDLEDSNHSLRSLTGELEQASTRAEAANAAKSMFLAAISHELRTPLNAVLGYTEMVRGSIEDGDFDPAEADEDLARVERAAQRLLGHVSRILDLTSLEADEAPNWEQVPLTPLLEGVLASHRAEADEKGLALTLRAAPSIGAVTTDRSRLERLVANLVENGIRFCEAGEVAVTLDPVEDGVCIEVRDTGEGIDEADRDRIFELFTQVDQSTTRRVEGVGLGLHLVKRLAHSLQAELQLRSAVGEGTRISVVLPARPSGSGAAAAAAAGAR